MSKFNDISSTKLTRNPVRRIGIKSRSITGTMPNGARYESSLERDLMILLNFDPLVHLYTPQPITISYKLPDGSWHKYTPDGLIEWDQDIPVYDKRPVLVEVKYREAFKNGAWKELLPKFRAARKLAKEKGWKFEIFTEDKIRVPLLDNAKFLHRYMLIEGDTEFQLLLLDKLAEVVETTPHLLISSIFKDKWNQAQLIPSLWQLVAKREVGCDLTTLLTMNSKVWAL